MEHYRQHFLQLTDDGFIQRPRYMDSYMSHAMRVTIGQLRASSHTLEIEAGRAARVPREQRLCRLCHTEVESEEHYVCRCPVYYEIRGRYHCLFRDGFGPLRSVMDYQDQRCLGYFLMELRRHRESLLRAQRTEATSSQTQITRFFGPIDTPAVPTVSVDHTSTIDLRRGVLVDRVTVLRATRRPRPKGTRPLRPHQRRIEEIFTRHEETMRCSRAAMADLGSLLAPCPMMDLLESHFGTGWE